MMAGKTKLKLIKTRLSPRQQLMQAVTTCWSLVQSKGFTLPLPLTIFLGGKNPLDLILRKIEAMSEDEAAELIRFIQSFGDGFDLSVYDELKRVAAGAKR